jgi:hypothetical protein
VETPLVTVTGQRQQCRGPSVDERHTNTGRRLLDRRAAEQSARQFGQRDPTDSSAGSRWSFDETPTAAQAAVGVFVSAA